MKWSVTVIALFVSVVSFAQIEIVQFSAEFLKDNEITALPADSNVMSRNDPKPFLNKGEEVYRVESGITLKLPENSIELIENEIEEIIESKF